MQCQTPTWGMLHGLLLLLLLVIGAFTAEQMSEELVWELFVQGGPIGEACVTRSMVLSCSMLCCPALLVWW